MIFKKHHGEGDKRGYGPQLWVIGREIGHREVEVQAGQGFRRSKGDSHLEMTN